MNKENIVNLLQSDYLNEKIYEVVVCNYNMPNGQSREGVLCTTLEKIAFYYEDTNDNSFFYTILIKELYALEVRKDIGFTYLDFFFYQDRKMSFAIDKNNGLNYKFLQEKDADSDQSDSKRDILKRDSTGSGNIRKDFVKSFITYILRHMKKTIKIDNDYIWNNSNKM